MKILHITQGYHPSLGGTEWLFQRISEELISGYGDEITVFTTNCYNVEGFFNPAVKRFPTGWQEINGVSVRRFPVLSKLSRILWKPQQLAYLYRLPGNQYLRAWAHGPIVPGLGRAIREHPADVIVSSSFPLLHMFTALKAARATHRGVVFSGHLHPEDDWSTNRPMIYKAIREVDRYISLTQYEADFVISRGADPFHTHVVGVGVTPEPFMEIGSQAAKRRYGVKGGPVIGYIGQIAAQKVAMLIEAMPSVWKRDPSAILLIAGSKTTYSTVMERIISRWPADYRKQTKVIYNFPEEEKAWLYNACDVFVYPSAWESFGIAYLEAWAAGKPVIGCRRGAVPWVINSGVDGLLVDYGDVDNLAGAILLLAENRELADNLGKAGRTKTLKRYTWKTIAGQFREVYTLAIEDNERRSRKTA
jgi:glycosyltransferase involved in cell wall biosynthesis